MERSRYCSSDLKPCSKRPAKREVGPQVSILVPMSHDYSVTTSDTLESGKEVWLGAGVDERSPGNFDFP